VLPSPHPTLSTTTSAFPSFTTSLILDAQNTNQSRTQQLGLPTLPELAPEASDLLDEQTKEPTQTLQDLHALLVETSVANGKLVCGHCGHEYAVKEGIANFLLPSHLV